MSLKRCVKIGYGKNINFDIICTNSLGLKYIQIIQNTKEGDFYPLLLGHLYVFLPNLS